MKTDVLVLVFGLLAYVQSASTGSETVWLMDMTAKLQMGKRSFEDHDLPDQLIFRLRRGSDALTLKLNRNYEINPNANIYVVQKLKDGRSRLVKTTSLDKEAVAYYQDKENGAYMTVRCVKRLNHQCDRVIKGNMQIEKKSYYLRPAETDNISRKFLEVRDLIGKRYLLLDETDMELEHKAATASSPNVADGHDGKVTDINRQLEHDYDVKVSVLIDSGIWERYSSRVQGVHDLFIAEEARLKIREAYSHIMNGVNLHYKTIEDPSISINIILLDFIFLQKEPLLEQHISSTVVLLNGKKFIEADTFLRALEKWDKEDGSNRNPIYDHAMLFTTYDLYITSPEDNQPKDQYGKSRMGGVCENGDKTSVIESHQYSRTVLTATHELAHNLGADHEGDATDCKSEDRFIMTTYDPPFNKTAPYSRNPWIFSNCSVDSFKKTLITKECVKIKGSVYNIVEWSKFMKKQPGNVFTPMEQCYLAYGPNSVFVGTMSEEICHLLRCLNPTTGKIRKKYIYAATGTMCGENMWCIEGRCLPINSE